MGPDITTAARVFVVSPCSTEAGRFLEDHKVLCLVAFDQVNGCAHARYPRADDHDRGIRVRLVANRCLWVGQTIVGCCHGGQLYGRRKRSGRYLTRDRVIGKERRGGKKAERDTQRHEEPNESRISASSKYHVQLILQLPNLNTQYPSRSDMHALSPSCPPPPALEAALSRPCNGKRSAGPDSQPKKIIGSGKVASAKTCIIRGLGTVPPRLSLGYSFAQSS